MSVVNNLSFGAQINSWVRETDQRMTAVFRESTQRVASIADNGVPVATGFARASIRGSLESMPPINPNVKGGTPSGSFGEISLVIAGATLGQTIYIGWTAAYVLPLEFGHSKQAPSGFVRLAAAQWPQVVSRVTEELKGRSSAQ